MKNNLTILSCRNLCVGYGKIRVLEALDLDFYPGEFVSLLGPNGAGKTTLLRTLSRIQPSLSGQINLKGNPLNTISSSHLARTMSVVLTQKQVPPLFQVYEFVAMGRYPYTVWTGRLNKEDDKAVIEALDMSGAKDLAFRDMDTLSDGEKQKVFIARALAQEPKIILLDEPTVHLDLKHKMEIMFILQRLCREKGITVLASLHDLEVASKVSDRVALVQDGGISDLGPPEEILNPKSVADLYEFNRASFSPVLGNIEIHSRSDLAKVFIVGGMGSGAMVYRVLAKQGYDMRTGILMENDIDTVIAGALGIQCMVQTIDRENPLKISQDLMSKTLEAMNTCDLVVDTGFKPTSLTQINMDLLNHALAQGKPVFALDKGEHRSPQYFNSDKVWTANSETGLADLINKHQVGPHGKCA